MTSKFWFLTGYSLKKKMASKWFLLVNLLLLVLIVGIMNINSIISFFGGDFDDTNELIVIDNTNYSYESLVRNLDIMNETLEMEYENNISKTNKTVDQVKEDLKDKNKILIVLNNSNESYLDAEIISKTYIDTSYYQYLYQALSNTKVEVSMMNTNVDQQELLKITSNIKVDREILDENEKTQDELTMTIMGSVFPTIILPVFILVIFLVQMIGNEIYEEKSSRSMEIIISNVSPKVHFFSKIVSGNVFVITQGLLLIIYAIIGLIVNKLTSSTSQVDTIISTVTEIVQTSGIADKLGVVLPLAFILTVLSFLTYSLIAGILASMTVSLEDYQQIQTPIVLITALAYYLAMMAGMFQGSILIRVLSYVPLISSLLSPALLIIGEITIIDVLISILVLIITNYILIKKGLKIYKVGILNYSTDKMWSKIFKAIKQ